MAAYTDIFIDQGSTYIGNIPVIGSNNLPVNLEGYSARGQIRRSHYSSIFTSFVCQILDSENGIVTISLTPIQTSALKPGRYVFDVEIYNSGGTDVVRISEGQVTVTPRVTIPED
jgi:hypothetical protein